MIPDYYYIHTRKAVAIVAVDEYMNVILKKDYQHPFGAVLIEVPAGTFDENETDGLAVAKRELFEETGYESNHWMCLGRAEEDPSKSSLEIKIYLVQDA